MLKTLFVVALGVALASFYLAPVDVDDAPVPITSSHTACAGTRGWTVFPRESASMVRTT